MLTDLTHLLWTKKGALKRNEWTPNHEQPSELYTIPDILTAKILRKEGQIKRSMEVQHGKKNVKTNTEKRDPGV